jgi:hypothetical protein
VFGRVRCSVAARTARMDHMRTAVDGAPERAVRHRAAASDTIARDYRLILGRVSQEYSQQHPLKHRMD